MCTVILSPRLAKYPVMGPTEYGHIREISEQLSTLLRCSMQLDKAIGFEARALDHWK